MQCRQNEITAPDRFLWLPLLILAFAPCSAQEQLQKSAGVEYKLLAFNHDGVRLLPGMHQRQVQQVRDFYMRLHPNDMLRGFRLKDKKWAPGKDLGGAYSERPLSFGQWLGGFARLAKSTGDAELRQRALYLMNEWAQTISDDGSYGYRAGEGGHYDYEKMVGGLVDMHEYLGSDEALLHLARITDWAEENLDRTNEYALPREWYTLAENLYRAYENTGDRRYRDFAQVWNYERFWNALAERRDIFRELEAAEKHPAYHAYSHVNSLSSAAMAYRTTGERHYLNTIVRGYEFLKDTQMYATGGFGPEENFVVPNGMPETLLGIRRGASNVDVRFHFETSCGSWAGFKLARYLMQFTGEAHYGDWIERLVYNGVGALVPMNDYGMIMYGSSYNIYGAQKSHSTVWFCCQGSLPQTVAEYHNLIYFHDDESLYVNLFIPSSVTWEHEGRTIRLQQETLFPESPSTAIRIDVDRPSPFALKLRVPRWAKRGFAIQINGETFPTIAEPGEWAVIDRTWHPSDLVTVSFDMTPRAEALPGYVSPVAILCGPVVMAQATTRDRDPPSLGPLRFPADYLEIGSSAKINPSRNLHTNQELRPFYAMRAGEFYRLYFERSGRARIPTSELEFDGDWEIRDSGRYASEKSASFSTAFHGTAVVWEGLRQEDSGIGAVLIDGEVIEEVDQYAYNGVYVPRMDQRVVPFRHSIDGLSPGEHTLEVQVLGKRQSSSDGTWINVSGVTTYR